MFKYLCTGRLSAFARRYHYDTRYLEELLAHSPAAFAKFASINLLSSHRRGIAPTPWCAAGIRAAMREDCGPCVQLACNRALEAGVPAATVAAIVGLQWDAMDEDLALSVQFTEYVLSRDPRADALREQVRQRWGEDGLISLGMTISASRVYPTMKYALGHGQACTRVAIAQRPVIPRGIESSTLESGAAGATNP